MPDKAHVSPASVQASYPRQVFLTAQSKGTAQLCLCLETVYGYLTRNAGFKLAETPHLLLQSRKEMP